MHQSIISLCFRCSSAELSTMASDPEDEIFALAGRLLVMWGTIDRDLEAMAAMATPIGFIVSSQRGDNKHKPFPGLEGRFAHRLKIYRRGISSFFGEDSAETRKLDRCLNEIRELEPLRAALAHGKITNIDTSRCEIIVTYFTFYSPTQRGEKQRTVSIQEMGDALQKLHRVSGELEQLGQPLTNWLVQKIWEREAAEKAAESDAPAISDQVSTGSDSSQSK